MILQYTYLSCLILSALTATWFYRELKSRQLFLFIPYLWLVSIQEVGLFLSVKYGLLKTTGFFYNIYCPVSASVFVFLFYRISINAPVRKLIGWLYVVYMSVTVITFLFILPITIYNSYLSLASGFVITCCGIFFLFNYFNLDSAEEERKWFPIIPITVGIITFYPVVNISFAFYKYLLTYGAAIFGIPLYALIPRVMSIFMYSCFTYAFYLCKKKN